MATGLLRTAAAVTGRDLRERSRDRTAYLLALVVPVVIVVVITLAFGRSEIEFSATFAVADSDGSELSEVLLSDVLGSPELAGTVTVERVDREQDVRTAVADGEAGAGIVIPSGFGEAAQGSEPLPITVYRAGDSPVAGDVAESLVRSYAAGINTGRITVATVALAARGTAGAQPPAELERGAATGVPAPPITAQEVDRAQASVSPATQFAPAMGVLFMFFAVGGQAQSIVTERKQGTWARMLASPVRATGILVGKAGAGYLLGALSLFALLTFSALVLNASWGSPLGVALLILTTAFAVTGVFALILSAARTPRQVDALMSFAIFGFAFLGGNFVSVATAPELLQRLALLTPNGWALRGFADLATGSAWTAVWPSYVVLAVMGAVCFAIAAARADRLVAQ
jgi:ABC-2 type transport system permease protein